MNGESIAHTEAESQKNFVGNQRLPMKCLNAPSGQNLNYIEILEKLGFKILAMPDPDDPLFIKVEFPKGLKKIQYPDQNLYSNLVNDFGHKRATIFYKAGSYGRVAEITFFTRFKPTVLPEDRYKEEIGPGERLKRPWYGYVMDNAIEAPIFTQREEPPLHADKLTRIQETLRCTVTDWLSKHYSDWRDVTAYWDMELFPTD